MKNFLRVKVGDFAPQESSRSFTPEGYLVCKNVNIAKAPQVRQYYAYEFEGLEGYTPDQVINIYTAQEHLFTPLIISQLQKIDLTGSHPPKNQINASNWAQYHGGYAENGRVDGEYLVADLTIKDKELIDLVQNNEVLELSLGYAADLVLVQGTAPDGTPYQAQFINFTCNHVALVKYGRCGGSCRVGDEKPQNKGINMEIVINGIRFDIGDNKPLSDAIAQQNEQLEKIKTQKIKIGDQEFNAAELAAVQPIIDSVTAENSQLKVKVGDLEKNQITPDKLDAVVAERAAVIADAKAIAGADVETSGCSCEAIKRNVLAVKAGDSVVQAILSGVAVGDASPEQVDTAFRALNALKSVAPVNYANGLQKQNVGDQDPGAKKEDKKSFNKADMHKSI